MAEGFGSHNKTSFPYDHWSVSNSLFCLSLSLPPLSSFPSSLPPLPVLGLSVQFLKHGTGFQLTFRQVSPS